MTTVEQTEQVMPSVFLADHVKALHVICTSPKTQGRDALKYIHHTSQVQQATDSYILIRSKEIYDSSVPEGYLSAEDVKNSKILHSVPVKSLDSMNYPNTDVVMPKGDKVAMLNMSIATLEKLVKYMKKAKLNCVDIFKHEHDPNSLHTESTTPYSLEFPEASHIDGVIMPCRTKKEI